MHAMCQCGDDARSMIAWLTRKKKKYAMSVGRDTSDLGPTEAMLKIQAASDQAKDNGQHEQ